MLHRLALASLACLALILPASPAGAEKVFFVGNSVTDTLNYEGLSALAAAAGREQTWGRHMIPGASLDWLWEHSDDGFFVPSFGPPPRALPNHTWDILSLQPFDRDIAQDLGSISNYLDLLFGGEQATRAQLANRVQSRILIFSRWPRRDEDTGRPARSYAELWARAYPNGGFNSNESAAYAPLLVSRLSTQTHSTVPLANRVFLVPVGETMAALDTRFRAGQAPGIQDVFDLYADGIHLNNVGAYTAALAYHTVIHRLSPLGLPVPEAYRRDAKRPRDRDLTPELAKLIQDTVWTTVRAEPLTGVPADGRLVITTPALPLAYADRPYSAAIRAAGAARPVFKLGAGSLPPGLELAPDGAFRGQPSSTGDFAFTVTVQNADGGTAPVSATYRLVVVADLVPKIVTSAALPETPRGGRLDTTLAASPGNGRLAWTVAEGKLPAGLSLTPEGRLSGSPTREGLHEFTLRVNDEDVGDPGDTRRFRLSVGRPVYGTFFIPRTPRAPAIDGDLGDGLWNLSQGVANAEGPADNTVKFGALWDAERLYVAVSIRDTDLLPAAPTKRPLGDRVSLLLDARHDRQAEFNQSHREFIVGLDGALRERGGRTSGVTHAVLPAPGGWLLEISIPWNNLGIVPGPDTVLGLDLINYDEDSTESYTLAYARSTPDAPRPDQWASLLLSTDLIDAPAAAPGRAPAVASAPVEKPLAHEPFEYLAGPLHQASGSAGSGFSQPWEVEGGPDAAGYAVVEPAPALEYRDLVTSGRALSGGHRYGTIGRPLVPLASRSSSQEIWISYLVRPIRRDAQAKLALDAGGAAMHDNEGVVRVQNAEGRWRLSLLNDSLTAATAVAFRPGVTSFHVLRLRGGAEPDVDLWIDPALDAAPSTPPDATLRAPRALAFDCINLYPDHHAGGALYDELRVGASFAAVAPRRVTRLAAPLIEPLPTPSLALPALVRLGPAAPGTAIHYTLDGSAPDARSPRATEPVRVPPGATLRAVTIAADGEASPVSGAAYGAR